MPIILIIRVTIQKQKYAGETLRCHATTVNQNRELRYAELKQNV